RVAVDLWTTRHEGVKSLGAAPRRARRLQQRRFYHGDIPVNSRNETCRCAGKGGPSECRRTDAGDRSAFRRLSDQCCYCPRKKAQVKPEKPGDENSRPT